MQLALVVVGAHEEALKGNEHGDHRVTEELEQLRALENGYRIRAAEIEGWTSVPVDVPEDVPIVEAALNEQSAG